MSLRLRVVLAVLIVATMVVATAVATTRIAERQLIDQIDERLATAVPLGPNLVAGPGGGEASDDGPRRFYPFFIGVVVHGELAVLTRPNLSGSTMPQPAVDAAFVTARAAARDAQPFTVDSTSGALRYRAVVRATNDPDQPIIVAAPLDEVDASVADIRTVSWWIAGVVLLILALVAWWVLRLGVRPVQEMTRAAATIADDDLSKRVPVRAPHTEAGELGLALNSMLDRLETAFDERARTEARLRRFVADASHELRTPVQTIRGYAELYRLGALAESAPLDDAMRRTEAEAVRMGSLVEELLTLARFDQGRALHLGPVDVAALAHDAAADARAIQPARTIVVESPPQLMIEADEHRLRQVLANVVGNALVHTPATSPVAIGVIDAGAHVVIEVRDHGPGMDEEAAARAFERFFRVDRSRSRAAGGSGLGLAIVHAAVTAHGGTVSLDSSPTAGTTVAITLPRDHGAPHEGPA
jgi:two-component system OmpR family sensor kinase